MPYIVHDVNEKGYTVKELSDHLLAAVNAGEGARQVVIGPTVETDDSPPSTPLAVLVVGVEANKESDGGENDIFWLYPDDTNIW